MLELRNACQWPRRRLRRLTSFALLLCLATPVAAQEGLRQVVEKFRTDRDALRSFYDLDLSPRAAARLESFEREWLERLAATDFDALSNEARVDYVLLRNHIEHA